MSAKVTTIAEEWQEFKALAYPNGMPPVQNQELNQCFFAGAYSMFCQVQRALAGKNDIRLEALRKEVEIKISHIIANKLAERN